MKLWYQSLAHRTEETHYGRILKSVIDRACDPGTEVHLQGLRQSAGIGMHYRVLAYEDTREVIYNAAQAERDGYDAFLVGNISDAGLREAREMVNIPVLGLCETSVHIASMMGMNFAFVSISDRWTSLLLRNVHDYGLSSRLLATLPLKTSPLELKRAMEDPDLRTRVVNQFVEVARVLIAQGAEVVIPAGGDVMVFLAEIGQYELDGVPLVNGINELIKMAEMAVRLRRMTGRWTSKRMGYAAPSGDFLARIRAHYGPHMYPGQE